MPSQHTVYIRLPNWIGDVCMALPALQALNASGASVRVCARPWAQDLLAGVTKSAFIPMTGRFATDLRSVAADRKTLTGVSPRGLLLPDSLSSAAVFRLAGVPSAGYRDDGRSVLLRWPQHKSREPLHAVQSWYRLTRLTLETWGSTSVPRDPPPSLGLPLTDAHTATALQTLRTQGLSEGAFVLIAPTATGLHKGRIKVWPAYEGLTQALLKEGVEVVYCVPPNEADQARSAAPSARALPPMGLGAFAALTRQARLVVCNDSGVSHLAAAAGARQLTLFGVTSSDRTGPWSPHAVCLGDDMHWPPLEAVVSKTLAMLAT